MSRLSVVTALLCVGCTLRPLDGGSTPPRDLASNELADLAIADLAIADLARRRDLGLCAEWQLVDDNEFLTGLMPSSAPADRTLRVQLFRPISLDCTQAGPVEITRSFTPDEEVVAVRGRRWEAPVSVCPRSQAGPKIEILTLHDGAGTATSPSRVRVEIGGQQALSVQLTAPASTACDPLAIGATCERDCQCNTVDPLARCLTTVVLGSPPESVCARSCSTALDCPAATPFCDVSNRCRSAGNNGCGFGCIQPLRCESMQCRPPDVTAPPPSSCTCQGDCPDGTVCAGALGCVVTCATVSECPAWASRCLDGVCRE